jgi:hypothetical protein
MSRLLAERLRDEARRQPTDLAALLEVAADRLEQYEEEAVATRDSVTEALLEAQRRDLAAAPAVQGEPVAWKEPAANWLREKAAAQQALNEQYPEHAKCYPTWENWVLKLNWLADELSVGVTPQPSPDVAGLVQQHHRDSAELRRLCRARDEQRDGRLAALERAAKAEADVAGLVEALERISKRASEAECRQVPFSTIQRLFVDIMQQADDALAAHRKGGE